MFSAHGITGHGTAEAPNALSGRLQIFALWFFGHMMVSMTAKQPAHEYTPAETDQRMEDALRRALNTPHKPNQAFVGTKAKPKPSRAKPASRKAKKSA
jgi:hypothetical protein